MIVCGIIPINIICYTECAVKQVGFEKQVDLGKLCTYVIIRYIFF